MPLWQQSLSSYLPFFQEHTPLSPCLSSNQVKSLLSFVKSFMHISSRTCWSCTKTHCSHSFIGNLLSSKLLFYIVLIFSMGHFLSTQNYILVSSKSQFSTTFTMAHSRKFMLQCITLIQKHTYIELKRVINTTFFFFYFPGQNPLKWFKQFPFSPDPFPPSPPSKKNTALQELFSNFLTIVNQREKWGQHSTHETLEEENIKSRRICHVGNTFNKYKVTDVKCINTTKVSGIFQGI